MHTNSQLPMHMSGACRTHWHRCSSTVRSSFVSSLKPLMPSPAVRTSKVRRRATAAMRHSGARRHAVAQHEHAGVCVDSVAHTTQRQCECAVDDSRAAQRLAVAHVEDAKPVAVRDLRKACVQRRCAHVAAQAVRCMLYGTVLYVGICSAPRACRSAARASIERQCAEWQALAVQPCQCVKRAVSDACTARQVQVR